MIKSALIRDKIENDVNTIIKEELGIAAEVKNLTDKILNIIKEKINTVKSVVFDDGAGRKFGDFTIDAFGKTLTVFFENYNFKDKSFYEKCLKKYGESFLDSMSNQYYMRSKLVYNSIIIKIVSISGYFKDSVVVQDIQHELEHIFQQTKIGRSFSNDELYNLVKSNIYSVNEFEHNVAIVLYMSFKFEIEGFANGLYAYIEKHKHKLNINSLFHESDAYEKLEQINNSLKFIKDNINNKNLDYVLQKYNEFNINKKNIIKIGEKTIHEMNYRFGRAYIKARDDLMKEGFMGILSPYLFL